MAAADATVPLMTAVRTAILADAQIASVTTKVYDWPPSNVRGPFITLNALSWRTWDTADSDGQEITIDVHAWDMPSHDGPATATVRSLMTHLRRLLHRGALTVSGHNLVLVEATAGTGPMLDPDGVTMHGVVTIRALVGHG